MQPQSTSQTTSYAIISDSGYSDATTEFSTTASDGEAEDDSVTLDFRVKFSKSDPVANEEAVQQALNHCKSFKKHVEDLDSNESLSESRYTLDSSSNVFSMEDYPKTTLKLERELTKAKQEIREVKQECEYRCTYKENYYNLFGHSSYNRNSTKLRWPSLVDSSDEARPKKLLEKYSTFYSITSDSVERLGDLKKIISYYSMEEKYNSWIKAGKLTSGSTCKAKSTGREISVADHQTCPECHRAQGTAFFVLNNILRLDKNLINQ